MLIFQDQNLKNQTSQQNQEVKDREIIVIIKANKV